MKEELGFILHDIQNVRERTTAAEGCISDIQITAILTRVNELKSDDIETRPRRNNVRIVGLTEKTEGRDTTEFV